MLDVLLAVGIVSGFSAVLALLLVLSESVIADYGQCTININGEKEITVEGGQSLLGVLREEKIFIPSACGGRGTCGVCKLKVLDGAGPVLPTETPFLTAEEQADNVRLSCQVKVKQDLRIEIPAALFNIKEYACTCAEIIELTYDMRLFRFKLNEPDAMMFVAGQFVQLLCPAYKGNNEQVFRAYSIASDPVQNGMIDLIIRRVPNGICTTWCFDYLTVGDAVSLNGPYGEFRLSETAAPMVFIAGGSGMAPFVSILNQMRNENIQRKAVYFFGANSTRDLCLLDEMRQFEKDLYDFTFIPVISRPENCEDGWDGQTGLVTEVVAGHYETLADHEGYLCGSPGMIDASVKVFVEKGMPEEKVYYDKFA